MAVVPVQQTVVVAVLVRQPCVVPLHGKRHVHVRTRCLPQGTTVVAVELPRLIVVPPAVVAGKDLLIGACVQLPRGDRRTLVRLGGEGQLRAENTQYRCCYHFFHYFLLLCELKYFQEWYS